MLLQPQYGFRGERADLVAQFPDVPAEVIAQSRFTALDFGERVFVTALQINENGTIDLTIRIDPTASPGRRIARAVLDTGRGTEIVATAEFFVL